MGNRLLRIICFLSALFILELAQGQSYRFYPLPSAWFNSVDGVQLGIHVKGQVKGTMDDGPHRLNVALAIGTRWPNHPISYYATLTEPVFAWSSFGSEAAFKWESQFRSGFESYSLGFSKRTQNGFIQNEYQLFSIKAEWNQFYSTDYALFQSQLYNKPVYFGQFDYRKSETLKRTEFLARVGQANKAFFQVKMGFRQIYDLNSILKIINRNRLVVQSFSTPHHLVERISLVSYYEQLSNPFLRASGTIPSNWVNSVPIGEKHEAGMRDFFYSDFTALNSVKSSTREAIFTSNWDIEIGSPLTFGFKKIPLIGQIFKLVHYPFFDYGMATPTEGNNRFDPIIPDLNLYYPLMPYPSVYHRLSFGFGAGIEADLPEADPFLKAFSLKYELPLLYIQRLRPRNLVSFKPYISISGTIVF